MKNLKQLALNLCLKDEATFTNFYIGKNQQLFTVLTNFHVNTNTPFIYLWGKDGSGKTHLLQALCQIFGEHDFTAAYLPLEDVKELKVEMLDDLGSLDLFCIDDIHLIAGDLVWEEKIFHCFNELMVQNKKIVITAAMPPKELPFKLPDLKSRMTNSLTFAVHELNDEEKIKSLIDRAKLRGLSLPDQVARFLLSHYNRDIKSLFMTLDKLDNAALVAKHKLTVPFIKDILQIGDAES
jgi:DnaA-homolog protein